MKFVEGMVLVHFLGRNSLWAVHLYDFAAMILYACAAFGLGRMALKVRFWRFLPQDLPSAILVGLSLTTFLSAVLSHFHLFFLMRYVIFAGAGAALILVFRYIRKKKFSSEKKVKINWALLSYTLLAVLFFLVVIDQASRRSLNDDDDVRSYIVAPVVLAHTNALPDQPFNYRETMILNGATGLFAPLVLIRDNPQSFIYLDVVLGFFLIAWMLREYYSQRSKNKYPYLLLIPLVICYSFVTSVGTANTTPVILAMALAMFCLTKVRSVFVDGSHSAALGFGCLLGTIPLWKGYFLVLVLSMVTICLILEVKPPSEWRKGWWLWLGWLMQQAGCIALGVLIVYLPWMIHSWIFYGTFFYPFLGLGSYIPDFWCGRAGVYMKARGFHEFVFYLEQIASFFRGNSRYVLDWFLILGFLIVLFYNSARKTLAYLSGVLITTVLAVLTVIPIPYFGRHSVIIQTTFVFLLFVHLLIIFDGSVKKKGKLLSLILSGVVIIGFIVFSFPMVVNRYKHALSGKDPADIYLPGTASIYYNKTLRGFCSNLTDAVNKYIPKGSAILYYGCCASYLPHENYKIFYSDGPGAVGVKEISRMKGASELRDELVKRGIRYWVESNALKIDIDGSVKFFLYMRGKYSAWSNDIDDWESFGGHNSKLYDGLKSLAPVKLIYDDIRGTIYDLNPELIKADGR